jgi:hypothetical protein
LAASQCAVLELENVKGNSSDNHKENSCKNIHRRKWESNDISLPKNQLNTKEHCDA